jgi:sterol desaturase/sphingolipid hydroxylase (fatty acid hydroxylase superfamily)
MNGCDGFEIAIEMRLHGAADRHESDRLDAHLATCPSCIQFEIEARISEKTLRERARPLEDSFNDAKIRDRIRRAQRNPWLTPLLVAAGFFSFVALAALDAWVSGGPFAFAKYPRVIVFFAAVTALFVMRSAQTVFGLRRAEGRRDDLLPTLRRDVSRRIRATLFSNVVIGALALFNLLLWPFMTPSPEAGLTRQGIGFVLFTAGLLGFAIYGFAAVLPRLERERAELA